ncbi:MAG: T9SS type A sorting domain-containing protein [Saprospiraceae bacterium]
MRSLYTLILFIISWALCAQTTIRIGGASGECGTMSNPCPPALCTASSGSENPRTITVPTGQRINFSFDQGGGCGSSTGYRFETGENLTLTWPTGNSVNLFSGDGSNEATGFGCYYNNSAGPINLTFTINHGTARRDEAVIFTYTLSTGNSGCSLLPVEYFNLTISKISKNSLIKFSTASETNNDYFTIERSGDGISFDAIGEIDGAGNSSEERHYEYNDDNPQPDINYYRIKQTDYDGQYSYSEIRSVVHEGSQRVAISPKQTQGLLQIATGMEDYALAVYSSAGQEVARYVGLSGYQTIDIAPLQSGIYFVKVVSGAHSETVKVVKY